MRSFSSEAVLLDNFNIEETISFFGFKEREREREREMTFYLRRKNRSGLKGEKNQYGVWDHLFEHQWMKGWGNRRHLSKDVGTFFLADEKRLFDLLVSHSNYQKPFKSIISIIHHESSTS